MNVPEEIVPKYYILKQAIINDITSGKYHADSRLPSESELKKKFNISSTPIKRVINELSKEGYIYTIQGKGCFVAEKNILKTKDYNIKTKRIAFITANVSSQFYAGIVHGMLDVLQPLGYTLETYYSKENYRKEMELLARCLKNNVEGVVFVPSFYSNDYRHLYKLKEKNIKIVMFSNKIKYSDFDFIGNGNYSGTVQAIEYLLKSGHKRIVFMGGGIHISATKEKLDAYCDTLNKNNIKIDKNLILTDDLNRYKSLRDEGYERTKRLLSKKIKFTAIFTKTDEIAYGAFKALKENNLKVPEDISIVGFDDIFPELNEDMGLTTVRTNIYNLGKEAASLLVRRINENKIIGKPQEYLVKTELIIRKSVKKIN